MTDKPKATYPISFSWLHVQPDRRQWKPSNPLLMPQGILVVVEVPLDNEHIYNATVIMKLQLSNDEPPPTPILTPKGMRYCIDELEKEMSEKEVSKDNTKNTSETEWEELPDAETDKWS